MPKEGQVWQSQKNFLIQNHYITYLPCCEKLIGNQLAMDHSALRKARNKIFRVIAIPLCFMPLECVHFISISLLEENINECEIS